MGPNTCATGPPTLWERVIDRAGVRYGWSREASDLGGGIKSVTNSPVARADALAARRTKGDMIQRALPEVKTLGSAGWLPSREAMTIPSRLMTPPIKATVRPAG